jgi:hypothetical protein
MLEDYGIKNNIVLTIFSPILSILELLIAVWILIPNTRTLGSLCGIVLQIIFIVLLTINYNNSFKSTCGCFELNMPREIKFKNIIVNFGIIFIFFTIINLQMKG